MSNDNIEQLSPQGDTRENEFGGLLAAASDFARGVLKTIHALAGTTACKGVQIARLKECTQKESLLCTQRQTVSSIISQWLKDGLVLEINGYIHASEETALAF